MTLFIEGLAFPLNEINANKWGIPETEAENAINSLKASVVRICSRDDPHGCDFTESPKNEIGRIVDAWQDGNSIFARASISDSIAEQKIKDGTWEPNWSVYLKAGEVNSEGWASDVEARSMTIVREPAWNKASWSIAAAEGEKPRMRTISHFTIITASQNKEGDSIPDTTEIDELKGKLAEKDTQLEELNPKIETLETQIGELTASKAELEKTLSEKTALIASLEKEKAGTFTVGEAKELVASAIEQYKAEVKAEQDRATAYASLVAARAKVGLETQPERYINLTASDLSKLAEEAEEFSGAKLTASGPINYPAKTTSENNACIGAYNGKTGVWE